MIMGEVTLQAQNMQILHNISYEPIHKSIQRIIPLLERRQEIVKIFYNRINLSEPEMDEYRKIIAWHNDEICALLNIIPTH